MRETMMGRKVALVTGAAVGIGRAIARQLAVDGIDVGVLDLDQQEVDAVAGEINAKNGGRAVGLAASVTDRAQVSAAVDKLRAAFGPVTVVVNNAGICDFVPFGELSDDQWDRMLDVNLKGVFICTQVVLPDMEAAKWGRIVNISSSSAQTGAKGLAHYSASKGGIMALTKTLAIELGPLGITVNNIPPGSVLNTRMSEENRHRFPIPVETLQAMNPVRRTGEPEDIANACSWLVREESSYVTGQTIGVNGGRIPS
jgi:2-hydroxycyclohexanecarboxyl-CoA dehydrogenase